MHCQKSLCSYKADILSLRTELHLMRDNIGHNNENTKATTLPQTEQLFNTLNNQIQQQNSQNQDFTANLHNIRKLFKNIDLTQRDTAQRIDLLEDTVGCLKWLLLYQYFILFSYILIFKSILVHKNIRLV